MRLIAKLACTALLAAALPSTPASAQEQRARNSMEITQEELQGSTAMTLFDAIQALRPNWLRSQQSQTINSREDRSLSGSASTSSSSGSSIRDGARAAGRQGEPTDPIRVYSGTIELGGIDELRNVALGEVARVERLRPAQANTRFGQGHLNGAIVVHLRTN